MNLEIDIVGVEDVVGDFEAMRNGLSDEVVYAVGSPLEYAKYQEYGTYFHPPQPYLRPAAEQTKANLSRIVAQSEDFESAMENIAEEVEEAAKARAPVRTGALRDSIETRRVK